MSGDALIETERLVLRRLVRGDAGLLFELDSDPEVRRYVHAGPPDLARIRQEILPRMRAYDGRFDHLGFWAAEEKPTRAFAGWFCLRPEQGLDGGGDPELGFRLRRALWGRGLATEGALRLVENGFAQPGTSRMVAVALVENRAAGRVLEKVGFERSEEFPYRPPAGAVIEQPERSRQAYRYALTRDRWRGASIEEAARTHAAFDLRPATERDYELMWKIQRTALGPYVDATWGWDEAFQRRYFDEHFDPRKHQIIVVEGNDAGFLSFEARGDHVYLGNLALLPAYQGRGIGADVARHVIQRADEAGLPIRLQVLRSNPARRFYERLGFEPCGETDTHFQMARAQGRA